MPPPPLYEMDQIDFSKPVYDIEAIRRVNPQRNQMEQLTAIVYVDEQNHVIVGYKDVTDEEFWVTGHMPGYPLMPGVIMCECGAQLAGFYAHKYKLLESDFIGFGGMDSVRFRAPVFPNSRLILMARCIKLRPGIRAVNLVQGFVNETMVFSGEIIGVPINRAQDPKKTEPSP